MDKTKLIQKLMTTFLEELDEHVRALNRDLLALESDPAGPARGERLTSLFRTAHSLKGASRAVNAQPIEAVCHRTEEILSQVRDGAADFTPDVFAVLFSAADAIEEAGMRLREQQDLSGAPIAAVLPRLDAVARGETPALPRTVESSSAVLTASSDAGEIPDTAGSVRIASEKLDALLARSGELLVARRRVQSRLDDLALVQEQIEQWRNDRHPAEAAEITARLGRLRRDVDDLAKSMRSDSRVLEHICAPLDDEIRGARMLPFAEACAGLDRLVRDLSHSGAKEVEFILRGDALEIDRSILEALKDPLRHLVRNAIDHGIEPAASRETAGKPRRARLEVSATVRGANVEVAVRDDGRGLDLDAVRAHAERRHIAVPDDEREVAALIFQPGFSTATLITDVSGRGVGLDVVKSRVESLHGSVDWQSRAGQGTTFTLRVPLTLTTLRAVLVQSRGHTYAIASANVARLIRVGPQDIMSIGGRDMIAHNGVPIALANLGDLLFSDAAPAAPAANPDERSSAAALVIDGGGRRAALIVDALVGEQEILIKRLGERVRRLPLVKGATILPSGWLALVLSAANLAKAAVGAAAKSRVAPADAAPARKRLLIAEDSLTTRTLEKAILEAAGYDVVTAADGQAAWDMLQTQPVDLLVTDIEMPRLDGFALTRAVRSSPTLKQLPVVLVTSRESDADKANGVDAGADAYLVKSAFDQRNLLETVGQLV